MNGFIKMWLRMLNHGGRVRRAVVLLLPVPPLSRWIIKMQQHRLWLSFFLLNSLWQKTKAIYYPRACDFFHLTKPRSRFYFAPTQSARALKWKERRKTRHGCARQQKTKAKIKKEPTPNSVFLGVFAPRFIPVAYFTRVRAKEGDALVGLLR